MAGHQSSDRAAKRPTLADVAALAGVSVSTASLAFSGSGPVSGSTRDRVLAAAEELHYAGPDPRGRSLRQGRSGIIGVVMEERILSAFRDPIAIAILDGIAQETTADGRGLLLLADVGQSAVAMESASMDGVILLGCSSRITRSIEIQRRRAIPAVALGGPAFDGVLTISLDDDRASEIAARHLAGLGHRDVAIVALAAGHGRRHRIPRAVDGSGRAGGNRPGDPRSAARGTRGVPGLRRSGDGRQLRGRGHGGRPCSCWPIPIGGRRRSWRRATCWRPA